MVMKKTLSSRRLRGSSRFTAVLTSVVLEWLLIFLLYVNALFSYLVTRFARFCELQTPCLLCSRLDNLFGNEAPGFYLDLICGSHKLEISSLGFCHVHNKLADVHGMCQSCLISFSTEKKSNSETYRLLVGALGTDLEHCDDQDPVLGFSSKRNCSCCNEPWTSRLDTHDMVQFKSTGYEVAELDIPLPDSVEENRVHLHDGSKCREKMSREVESNVGTKSCDSLSHIGYSELKITSDSESEVPLSDDDNKSSLVRGQSDLKEEIRAQSVPLGPHIVHLEYLPKTLSNDLAQEELIHRVSVVEPSLLVPQVQHDVNEPHHLASVAVLGHGLEELNSHQVENKTDSFPPEFPSLQDVPSSSNAREVLVEESALNPHIVHLEYLPKTLSNDLAQEELIHRVFVPEPSLLVPQAQQDVDGSHHLASVAVLGHGLEELNSHQVEGKTDTSPPLEFPSSQDVPSSSNAGEVLLEELEEISNVTGTDVLEPASLTGIQEIRELENGLITSTGSDMRENQVFNDRGPPMTNLIDLSDAYKLVISNKGAQSSNMPEQITVKNSTRVSGDLKLWLSQISSARGLELTLSEMSPRVLGQWEDLKISDASSPIGLQILQKRISLERNMSGFESLDGSIVSEIEGESLVDRLKRQVEYDRKSVNALYKELEEERNASGIAANQALAMITRLQEEKATMQMEALQDLRMMEEQAEYDVDALQKLNDLLAEKQKEVQDLEAELQTYREKFLCEPMVEKTQYAACDSQGGNIRVDHLVVGCIGNNINTPCNTPREHFEGPKNPDKTYMVNGYNSTQIVNDSLVGFEDERSYISQCLKKLEKKLHLFSNNDVHFPNGEYSGKEENGVDYLRQHCEEVTQESSSDYEGKDQETHLVALELEVSDLNERLRALEADRNFLEHTINSLQTGNGIEFIQEIAHDLRELRKIGIRREQALRFI